MCTSAEEPGEQSGVAPAHLGPVDIAVVAPRIGIDMDVFSQIDWGEVARLAGLGAGFGSALGGLKGAIVGGAGAAATAVESQPGINLDDLFEIKNDMILINGVPGNLPLY